MISSDIFGALPPFLRVLLVTDGTVTKSLGAYFGEAIDVDVLMHELMSSDRDYPPIGINYGRPMIERRVILRGRVTRMLYAFAKSVICNERISPRIRERLIEGRQGIGEALLATRQKTFREILSVQGAEAGALAGALDVDARASVMIRHYTICDGASPSMYIEEVFPVRCYESERGRGVAGRI